nr:PREDICTED: uncharacterized protein LOC106705819 [Latimeria chalumnae]|eukprot:XP_014351309.1 PREDICTED: uncharacterized protein LOC106705819 [Latimeria chalumnae]
MPSLGNELPERQDVLGELSQVKSVELQPTISSAQNLEQVEELKQTEETKEKSLIKPGPTTGQPSDTTNTMDTTPPTTKTQTAKTDFQTGKTLYSNILKSNSTQDNTSRRKNVVRLSYLKDNPPDRDYVGRKLLIETMNITALQVYAFIHIHSSDTYDISFRTSFFLELFWKKYQTLKDTKLWEDFIAIKISQPNIRWATILFKNELVPSTDITFWLKRHCTPLTELQPLYDRNGFWTGGYKVQIHLRDTPIGFKHLPCQLTIGWDRGYIFYPGQERTCFKCGSTRHLSTDCEELFCSKCSRKGHLARECMEEVVCNLCAKSGHSYHNCPKSVLHNDTTWTKDTLTAEEKMEREKEDMVISSQGTPKEQTENVTRMDSKEKTHQTEDNALQNPPTVVLNGSQNGLTDLPSENGEEKQTADNMEEDNAENGGKTTNPDFTTAAPMMSADIGISVTQSQPATSLRNVTPTEEIPSTSQELKMDSFQLVAGKEKRKSKALTKKSSLDWAAMVANQEEQTASRILRKQQPGKTTQTMRKGKIKEPLKNLLQTRKLQKQKTVILKNRYSPLDTDSDADSITDDLNSPDEIMDTFPEYAGEKRRLSLEDTEKASRTEKRTV